MTHYTTLLFDLDGTISESAPGILRSVRYGLDAVGIHETDEKKLRTFIGPPLNTQMKKLYGMKDDDIVTAITKFRESCMKKRARSSTARPMPASANFSLSPKPPAMYLPSHRASRSLL